MNGTEHTTGQRHWSSLFFQTPRLTALAMLVIVAAGLSAFLSIGRQEDPPITNLFATIKTVYPGADPARVEALVSEPIERALREIAEISEIRSTSSTGISIISVELSETLNDAQLEPAWAEIRDKLGEVAPALPTDVLAPAFSNSEAGAYAAISVLTARDYPVSAAVFKRYATVLADRLRGIPGTRLVRVTGAVDEEISVQVDPAALASLGLTTQMLAQRIEAADAKVRAGRLRADNSDYLIEVQGEFESIERLGRIPIAVSANDAVTRLQDIALITKGFAQPRTEGAFFNGERAVVVAARAADGLQIDRWAALVREEMAQFEAGLPDNIAHRQIFDQSEYTAQRLTEVGTNMLIGVVLVILVLLLTMGLRSAAIVALVLPLVSLASMATLNFMGLSVQQMSVTGLIVALGLLVDAAIVMTDEIGRALQAGANRLEAVRASVTRLTGPLVASTLTTALAFMPMVLLPGGAGDFVGSIAISVIVMLIWSLLIALTITPALAGWTLPQTIAGKSWLSVGIRWAWVGRVFAASLRWSLRHRLNAILFSLVLPVMGFLAFPTLTAQFFPGVDRNQFYVDVEMPTGASLVSTEALIASINADLMAREAVDGIAWVTGKSAPPFYYNMQADRDRAQTYAQALVTTASPQATATLVPRLQREMRQNYPQARVLIRDLVQGPPVNAPVELRLVASDLAALRQSGDQLRQIMATVPEIDVTRASLDGGAPKLSFRVDEDKARLVGMSLTGVASQLEAAIEGTTAGALIESTELLPVRVRVDNTLRADYSFIRDFDLMPQAAMASANGTGQTGYAGIPLSALAQPVLMPAQSEIKRRNGERINTIQGFVQYGVLPEEALQSVNAAISAQGFELPAGMRLEFGGDSDARSSTVNSLLAPLGLIVTLSIATIVLVFNSFRLTVVTLVVGVLSAGLSMLSLALFQYPFGINAIIGVIGSIGVSINAAIIILTALQADAKASRGDVEAMVRVVMNCSRHIVSTTITTFGGFLPLILAGGGFWPPFAMSVAGGVLLSAFVSFYFTPPVFALLVRRRASRTETDAGDTVLHGG